MDEQEPSWTIDNARTNLADVIDKARDRPQFIDRDGRPAAVRVSAEEWARQSPRRESLADFLLRSPLKGLDLDLARDKDPPRDIDL